jgi:hypothetical protein
MATRRKSLRKGGYLGLGNVIRTAIVPGALLAMQQSYTRKKNGGKGTRRKRRHH